MSNKQQIYLKLGFEEAATNIINYAYGEKVGEISIQTYLEADHFLHGDIGGSRQSRKRIPAVERQNWAGYVRDGLHFERGLAHSVAFGEKSQARQETIRAVRRIGQGFAGYDLRNAGRFALSAIFKTKRRVHEPENGLRELFFNSYFPLLVVRRRRTRHHKLTARWHLLHHLFQTRKR